MDVVLRNARFYTADATRPWADVVVIRGDKFDYVGDADEWSEDENLPTQDLGGRLVIPGLIDSHTHPSLVAQSRWHVRLPWTNDVEELLAFVRQFGKDHSAEEYPYIYFEYYPTGLFGDAGPTRELIDSAISDRPVLLQEFSEHRHGVNSKMLDLLGVTKETPDPVPGLEMFARDEAGEPTGHVFESAHMNFIENVYDRIGWRPPAISAQTLRPVLDFLTQHGVTSLFEAYIGSEATIQAVADLERAGGLQHYYEGSVRFRRKSDLPEAIATVRTYQTKYGSDRIRVRTLKLFLDGTNESGNSAVLMPLSNDTCGHNLGEIQMETDELTECLVECNESDIDLHIHMVGDRAFRVGCDAVEAAQQRVAASGEAWRTQVTFAHCELVDPADMPRPAELGIFVNWTTHWSGGYFGEEGQAFLGDRWDRMYAFNVIADSGGALTFSSDTVTNYELNRANPFFGMQVAHTRVDPQYPLPPERHPGSVRPADSSCLGIDRLLHGYTIEGARQLRLDDRVGSIEKGKVANLVVLDQDLFGVPAGEISQVKPTAVLFEGAVVAGELPND